MRLRPSVVTDAGDLPGNLHACAAAGDLEVVILNFLRDINGRRTPDSGELITEIAIERFEPFGEIHNGFAFAIEHDVTAINVRHLGRLDGSVGEILAFRVEGIVNAEVLRGPG